MPRSGLYFEGGLRRHLGQGLVEENLPTSVDLVLQLILFINLLSFVQIFYQFSLLAL